MPQLAGIYRIALLPGVKEEDFEKFMIGNVFPAVNKALTESGSITRLSLLKDNRGDRKDKYLWIIEWSTIDEAWFSHHIADALEKLMSVGIPISFSVFNRLDVWQK